MSQQTKVDKFRLGHYLMPVPPVCPAQWNEQNWIDFIDNNGVWL